MLRARFSGISNFDAVVVFTLELKFLFKSRLSILCMRK